MSRRWQALLVAGIVAVTAIDIVTFYVNGWAGPPGRPIYLISPLLVLDAYLVVGWLAWRSHPDERIGLLFTATGYAWFLPLLNQIHASVPFAIASVTGPLYQATLTHLALAWPYGRLRTRADRVVVAANYALNISNPIASNLFWNPKTEGCHQFCPNNLMLVRDSPSLYNDINNTSTWVGTAMTVAVVALFVRHWARAEGYPRRAMTRLVLVAIPIAGYIELVNFEDNLNWPYVVINGYGPLVLLAAPAAYVLGQLWMRRARSAVGVALVDLEPGPPPRRLQEALAHALGDPKLSLALRPAAGNPYVDTADNVVDLSQLPAGRGWVALDDACNALLIFDEHLTREQALFRIATSAARLALEHARLREEIEAQLEQVQASRARIVEAGDAERRRLERDLHDGAQQRLVTLHLALGMAGERADRIDPELAALIGAARTEARTALVELRELARGLHPAVLTETGLRGGIEALVERSPVPTTVTLVPAQRLAAPVEAAAYFVVSEALTNIAKHAPGAAAEVTISCRGERLSVCVADNGPGGARVDLGSGLRGLADRVSAVGGTLSIRSPLGAGTRLQAEIPLR